MSFNKDALDRYITGNYGEDQFDDTYCETCGCTETEYEEDCGCENRECGCFEEEEA